MRRVDVAGHVRVSDAGREAVQLFFLYRRAPGLPAVVRAFVQRDLRQSRISAVDDPARAVVVRRVAVPLLMHVAHLDEAVLRVAVELARGLPVAQDLRHPRLLGSGRFEHLFHQGSHLERQLGVFAVAPHRAHLRDVALERIVLMTHADRHGSSPLLFVLAFSPRHSPADPHLDPLPKRASKTTCPPETSRLSPSPAAGEGRVRAHFVDTRPPRLIPIEKSGAPPRAPALWTPKSCAASWAISPPASRS